MRALLFFGLSLLLTSICRAEDQVLCNAPVDLILIMDKSASISDDDLLHIIDFTRDLSTVFNIAPSGAHMAVLKFATYSDYVMCLTGTPCAINVSMGNEIALKPTDALKLLTQTDLGTALTLAKTEFATRGRTEWDSRHIIVIMSDGKMTAALPADVAKIATDMKAADKKMTIWTLAVGADDTGKVFLRDQIASGTGFYLEVQNYTYLARDMAVKIVGSSCTVVNYGSCTHISWLLCLLILIHCVHINFILWRHPPITKWRRIAIWDYWVISVFGGVLFLLTLIMLGETDAAIRNGLCSAIIAFAVLDLVATLVAIFCMWYKNIHKDELVSNPQQQEMSKAARSTYLAGGGTLASMNAMRIDGDKVTAPVLASTSAVGADGMTAATVSHTNPLAAPALAPAAAPVPASRKAAPPKPPQRGSTAM